MFPPSRRSLFLLTIIVGLSSYFLLPVQGHGRLWDPPARNTMHRRGFTNVPIDYNDNQLFCGGLTHQISQGYKCGICGDAYDGVRHHELGGMYSTPIIAREYSQGAVVNFQVDLTANHQGYSEFKLCPTNSTTLEASQECLDAHVLPLADGSGTRKHVDFVGPKMIDFQVRLPANVVCDFCVIQWRYHAANNWGTDADGTSCVGCGYQEEFYGCANVRIVSASGGNTISPVTNQPTAAPVSTRPTAAPNAESTASPTTTPTRTSTTTTTTTTTTPARSPGECRSHLDTPAYNLWCQANCAMGHCPSSLCTCDASAPHLVCQGRGPFSSSTPMAHWCTRNCRLNNCPASHCSCVWV